jgi:hypothetical protein
MTKILSRFMGLYVFMVLARKSGESKCSCFVFFFLPASFCCQLFCFLTQTQMRPLLFFTLFFFCRALDFSRFEKESDCASCVTGVRFLGVGLDAAKNRLMAPILNLSFFEQQKTWWSETSQAFVLVPDSVSVSRDDEATVEKNVFRSEQEYSRHLSKQSGVGIDLGAFGASADMQTARSWLDGGANSFVLAEELVTLHRLSLAIAPGVYRTADVYDNAVSLLPQSYDQGAYFSFISIFGTHVVLDVTVGGKSSFMGSVSAVYSENNTDFVVGGNLQVAYNGFKGQLGASSSRTSTSSRFASSSSLHLKLVGGNTALSDWTEWLDSIPLSPSPVRLSTVSVAELIPNPVIGSNLARAISEYIVATSALGNYSAPPSNSVFEIGQCNCVTGNYDSKSNPFPTGFAITKVATFSDGYLAQPTTMCLPCVQFVDGDAFGAPFINHVGSETHRDQVAKRKLLPSATNVTIPLPGLDLLGVGYDAVTGRFLPLPVLLQGPLTSTFIDPYTKQNYSYPNNVQFTPGAASTLDKFLFKSAFDISSKFSEAAGLGGSFDGFGGSIHVSQANRMFQSGQCFVESVVETTTLYSLLLETQDLHPNFVGAASILLPANYTEHLYWLFVQFFGTHFVRSADLGGQMEMKVAIDTSFYKSNYEQVDELSVQLFQFFQAGVNSSVSSEMRSFAERSFAEAHYFGGDFRTILVENSHDLWKKSLWKRPMVTQPTLEPIYNLLPEPQRTNMKKHVEQYAAQNSVRSSRIVAPPVVNVIPRPDLGGFGNSSLVCPFYGSVAIDLGFITGTFEESFCLDLSATPCGSFQLVPNPDFVLVPNTKSDLTDISNGTSWLLSPSYNTVQTLRCSGRNEEWAVTPLVFTKAYVRFVGSMKDEER